MTTHCCRDPRQCIVPPYMVEFMARSADPNSAGCQFFVCHGDARFLDRQYTAFGEVTAGDSVLEQIATVPTGGGGENSTPIERVEVKSITIQAA